MCNSDKVDSLFCNELFRCPVPLWPFGEESYGLASSLRELELCSGTVATTYTRTDSLVTTYASRSCWSMFNLAFGLTGLNLQVPSLVVYQQLRFYETDWYANAPRAIQFIIESCRQDLLGISGMAALGSDWTTCSWIRFPFQSSYVSPPPVCINRNDWNVVFLKVFHITLELY